MGAKFSKKKKSYCLGAGKDGESTETTEVEQKGTETQNGQKDAVAPKEETPQPDKPVGNGTSEEQKPQVEKQSDPETKQDEPTKDEQNAISMPENNLESNKAEAEETPQEKTESNCSSAVQEHSSEVAKDDRSNLTQKAPPSHEPEKTEEEQLNKNLDSSSDPPCDAVAEPEVKQSSVEKHQVIVQPVDHLQEATVKEAAEEHPPASQLTAEKENQLVTDIDPIPENTVPLPEEVPEVVVTIADNNEKVTTPVIMTESSPMQMQTPNVAEISKLEEESKQSLEGQSPLPEHEIPEPVQTPQPIAQTEKPDELPVLATPEPVAEQLVPLVDPVSEEIESLEHPQAHMPLTTEPATEKELVDLEATPQELKSVAEPENPDHVAEPVTSEGLQQSQTETGKVCENETKQSVQEDEQPQPKTSEVPEQPAHDEVNTANQESSTFGNKESEVLCSQSSDVSSNDKPELISPKQEICTEIPSEVSPLQTLQDSAAELPVPLEPNAHGMKLEDQSSDKHSVEQEKCVEEENKAEVDVVQETLNQEPIDGNHTASSPTAVQDTISDPSTADVSGSAPLPIIEDKIESHVTLAEESVDEKIPSDVQIVDKHVTLNGLPSKEEIKVKENLENGSNHAISELNGQNEKHEIEVCNE
ncbi:MGC86492 protein [Xenopus laevis]|uniref:MGC86492 protein n=1 Tax=Xenopus laevis TaxID=8355 RepID=Q66IN5_XENLA|nr:uncharacterized protein LOC447642 [Xenopus laevis]AAH81276.1 MGC86492 protein [Xenopus laevis]